MTAPSPWRRRLILGGVVAGGVAVWNLAPLARRLLPQRFDFEPVADPAGFRTLAGGATTAASNPLIGLDRPAPETLSPDAVRADLCRALFGAERIAPGEAPVASFSDYFCPYCRALTQRLSALEAEGAVRMRWHEWPLFGPTSETAARAALAADLQGAYAGFHKAMMRGGFIPTPQFLADLAARLGLDPARMAADMDGPEVSRRLAETRALTRLFGFIGTPSLVVGRTVITGAIEDARLRALIERERDDGPPPGCA